MVHSENVVDTSALGDFQEVLMLRPIHILFMTLSMAYLPYTGACHFFG
jgi:hypothetical protein